MKYIKSSMILVAIMLLVTLIAYTADVGMINGGIIADGVSLIGDGGTTNYLQIAADGTLTLVGAARADLHLFLQASSGNKAGVQDPSSALVGEFAVEQFSQAVTQNLYFTWHVPTNWASTTDVSLHIHWSPVNANVGNVVWDLDYLSLASENNELLTAATTDLTITDSTQTTQDELLMTGDLTIVAANLAINDTVSLHLSRDTGDGADNYGSAASFVGLAIEYTIKGLGE